MATRQLVLWLIRHPDKMHEWAYKKKESLQLETGEVLDQVVKKGPQGSAVGEMECPET